jgi:hypothetical protein
VLVTLSTTHVPATDLGFLLHKNPARAQQVEVSTGTAHVFYPEADEQRCTVALLLEVDPVGLVRTARAGGAEAALAQYVNDRPYAGSSLLAVALGRAFSSARRGVSKERPELVDVALPLEVHVPALSCRGGADVARRFFAPLGWRVEATPVPLDETFPDWGDSRYVDLRLAGELRLADALNHLYVALPVLDDAKHHWIGADEVEKLLRAGSGWLAAHPERDLITRRYLGPPQRADPAGDRAAGRGRRHRPPGAGRRHRTAGRGGRWARAVGAGRGGRPPGAPGAAAARRGADRPALGRRPAGRRPGLRSRRVPPGAAGRAAFTEVVGVDVSARALEVAARRLRLDRLPERQRARVRLLQSGLTYTDARLRGYDAAVLMEVVEHLDPDRLPALEHAVFAAATPTTVVVTTPNVEYNVRFEALPAGAFRHPGPPLRVDAQEFADWTTAVGDRHGYAVRLLGVGDEDPDVGTPSQMAVSPGGRRRERHERRAAHRRRPRPVPGRADRGERLGQEHLRPPALPTTQVLSSDACRGLVADDENDQSATPAAFALLHHIAGIRLRAGRLTVVDATNVKPEDRASLVRLAREHDVLPVAIVSTCRRASAWPGTLRVPTGTSPPVSSGGSGPTCGAGCAGCPARIPQGARPRRHRGGRARRHHLREAVQRPARGHRPLRRRSGTCTAAAPSWRSCSPSWATRCAATERAAPWTPSTRPGAARVFVGDLGDRGGSDSPACCAWSWAMDRRGPRAVRPPGNHEHKLVRALQWARRAGHPTAWSGHWPSWRPSRRSSGRQVERTRRAGQPLRPGRRGAVVAHAGLKESLQGRSSGRVRSFALYGDTTGETDEFGPAGPLPLGAGVPRPRRWCSTGTPRCRRRSGSTHPLPGHRLRVRRPAHRAALPGRELVASRAADVLRAGPPVPARGGRRPPAEARPDGVLDVADVLGKRVVETRLAGRVTVREENAAAAIEVMSRFAVAPEQLLHLPPTMSPRRRRPGRGCSSTRPRRSRTTAARGGRGRLPGEAHGLPGGGVVRR